MGDYSLDDGKEVLLRLIGREAGYELAFTLAGIGIARHDDVTVEASAIVDRIINDRRQRYPTIILDSSHLHDAFVEAMIETYREASPRIIKAASVRPLQPA